MSSLQCHENHDSVAPVREPPQCNTTGLTGLQCKAMEPMIFIIHHSSFIIHHSSFIIHNFVHRHDSVAPVREPPQCNTMRSNLF
jgi:hypothetical protein